MVGEEYLQRCGGCGSQLPAIEASVHAYMTSSPACWHAFGLIMARGYTNPKLMDVHRLSVDTWAVQHPGDGSRRAIQSVGLHLARLMVQLEEGLDGNAANAAMLEYAARKSTLPELPVRRSYSLTVVDVIHAVEQEDHRQAVQRWAKATWTDWSDQHEFIRSWALAR